MNLEVQYVGSEYAGVKVRALLLARGLREVDLLSSNGLPHSPGFFAKYVNRLVHGKEQAAPHDPKIRYLAHRLRVPANFLTDDALWPDARHRLGLTRRDAETLAWLRSLYGWYIRHAGTEAAHKYLGLDFDVLHRQSQILQGLARSFGAEALIRVFVGSDYEDGRFNREFARVERLAERSGRARRSVLDYLADLPPDARVPDRRFLPLRIGDLQLEVSFTENLPQDRTDVRYAARGPRGARAIRIRAGLRDDERLAFILAREVAIDQAVREGVVPAVPYEDHHWPCAIDSYARQKAEVIVNRFAAAILLPRSLVETQARELLLGFSHGAIADACLQHGCAPENLFLRIVHAHPRQAHFIRVDAPGPEGPFTLEKLFRGNGLPVQHPTSAQTPFSPSWGVMKSAAKFFAGPPEKASHASRHVQITRMAQGGSGPYICMSLTYPRYGGGAKVLCIGFKLAEFRRLYGGLPRLSEKRIAVDDLSHEVDWKALVEREGRCRHRRSPAADAPRAVALHAQWHSPLRSGWQRV